MKDVRLTITLHGEKYQSIWFKSETLDIVEILQTFTTKSQTMIQIPLSNKSHLCFVASELTWSNLTIIVEY